MSNYEMLIGIVLGSLSLATGAVGGFYLCMYSFRKGSQMVDRIYHDLAPFDEALNNTEPLDSHTDGVFMDKEE